MIDTIPRAVFGSIVPGQRIIPSVLADPSHGTGHASLVAPMSKAAIAAGADGLIIEVHPHPEKALVDGAQSLNPEQFTQLMKELKPLAEAVGREL